MIDTAERKLLTRCVRRKHALVLSAVVAVLAAGALVPQSAFSLPRADAPKLTLRALLFPGDEGFTN